MHPAGTLGGLWLSRRQRLLAIPVRSDASGESRLVLPLPADAALTGTSPAVQVGFRFGGSLVFGETVLDALIL